MPRTLQENHDNPWSDTMNHSKSLSAVCFDYRGTLIDHSDEQKLVPGMENLLDFFEGKNIGMALVSRFPADILMDRLGHLRKYFNKYVYSGGGKEKLDCIKIFARTLKIDDLSQMAFIDDKPDNFVPVATHSDVFVIGFKGSGKYSGSEAICEKETIAFAKSSGDIKKLLSNHFVNC